MVKLSFLQKQLVAERFFKNRVIFPTCPFLLLNLLTYSCFLNINMLTKAVALFTLGNGFQFEG